MQKHTFSNGGFCLHDLRGIIAGGKVSAWYDANGRLLDCEYFPDKHPDEPRRIPARYTNARAMLERHGLLYRDTAAQEV